VSVADRRDQTEACKAVAEERDGRPGTVRVHPGPIAIQRLEVGERT
jgi:hypothetical protein